MKISSDEFKKLKALWDKRLSSEGFDELGEQSQTLKRFEPPFLRLKSVEIEERRRYYESINDAIAKTKFRSERDRYILTRHAEGAMIKTIAEELHLMGHTKRASTVTTIIRRYQMAWGIRTYTRKQLELK